MNCSTEPTCSCESGPSNTLLIVEIAATLVITILTLIMQVIQSYIQGHFQKLMEEMNVNNVSLPQPNVIIHFGEQKEPKSSIPTNTQ